MRVRAKGRTGRQWCAALAMSVAGALVVAACGSEERLAGPSTSPDGATDDDAATILPDGAAPPDGSAPAVDAGADADAGGDPWHVGDQDVTEPSFTSTASDGGVMLRANITAQVSDGTGGVAPLLFHVVVLLLDGNALVDGGTATIGTADGPALPMTGSGGSFVIDPPAVPKGLHVHATWPGGEADARFPLPSMPDVTLAPDPPSADTDTTVTWPTTTTPLADVHSDTLLVYSKAPDAGLTPAFNLKLTNTATHAAVIPASTLTSAGTYELAVDRRAEWYRPQVQISIAALGRKTRTAL